MKTIDLFCASPASTAICSSMNQRAVVRHGSRSIDRNNNHNHNHIPDHYRRKTKPPIPYSSSALVPLEPKPYNYQKSRKSEEIRCKSSADVNDIRANNSSTYLLSDKPFIDFLSDKNHDVNALVSSQSVKPRRSTSNDYSLVKSSSAPTTRTHHQVVELRVSIHCKGCEGKVRKHISRMEGVTSYSIDLATKKVTIIGDVTPLGVLTSVSRVKSAQFWPSPTPSSSSRSSSTMLLLN